MTHLPRILFALLAACVLAGAAGATIIETRASPSSEPNGPLLQSSESFSVDPGESFPLSGTVRWYPSGEPYVGAHVQLQRQPPGGSWATVATDTTDSGGRYSFARSESTSGTYRFHTLVNGQLLNDGWIVTVGSGSTPKPTTVRTPTPTTKVPTTAPTTKVPTTVRTTAPTTAPSTAATTAPPTVPTTPPTPVPSPNGLSPRFSPGDLVYDTPTDQDMVWLILGYDALTDQYQMDTIFRYDDGHWGYRLDTEVIWFTRDYIDNYVNTLITHVDPATVAIGYPGLTPTPTTVPTPAPVYVPPTVVTVGPISQPVGQPVATLAPASSWGKRYAVGNPGSFLGARSATGTAPTGTGTRRVAAVGPTLKPGSVSRGITPPPTGSFVRWYPAARWAAGIT